MSATQQVTQAVLANLWTHAWSPVAATKQQDGTYALTGGMLINWEQGINWASYDPFLDVNEVATTGGLYGGGFTQVNAHDPQVCLHYLRAVALYRRTFGDTRFDGNNTGGHMGIAAMVDHVTLCDFVPQSSSTQTGNKGYSNPKGWVYFALLDCYLALQGSPLLSSGQVAALKSSLLYQAWTYYNVWYDASIPILCSTSHSPETYQPSQSLYMAAALLDAAQRFPSDISTGMFYSATGAVQSASLWSTAALSSIPSILGRGGWNATYSLFNGDMTVQPGQPTDLPDNTEATVGDTGEAAIALIHLYTLTGNGSYLALARTALDSIESLCWDSTNGGYFFGAYTDGITPVVTAYKESRAAGHMLYAYALYDQINPVYAARRQAIQSALLSNYYKTAGDTGYWYRTAGDAGFSAYTDKYVNPFADTLYAQSNAGASSIQVNTDVNLSGGGIGTKISLIFEPRTANEEEVNVLLPAVAQGTRTTLAQDTFSRADQAGWGTASDGGTWSTLSGTATLAISSARGTLGTPNSTTLVQLGTGSYADGDIVVRWSVSNLAHRPGLIARISGSGATLTYYEMQLVNTGTGIKLSKTVNGVTSTQLTGTPGGQNAQGFPNFPIVTGHYYWFRFRIQGSTLAAKCWQDGTSEQLSWDVQTTDTSIPGAGGAGIVGLCTTGAADTYDSFSVTTIPLPYLLSIDPLSNGGVLSKTHAVGSPVQSPTFPDNNLETQYTTEAMTGVLVYLLLTTTPPLTPMSIFFADSPYGLTIGLNPGSGPAANYAYWTNLFADMAALGLTWLRFQLSWRIIQLSQFDPPSAWAWGALDDAVVHCNAAGINLSYTLRGAPSWALTNSAMQATTEAFYLPDPTMYAYFAAQVALRYNGVTVNPNTGLPYGTLQSIEFGNEDWNIHHTPPGAGWLGIHASPYAEYNGTAAVTTGIEPSRDPYFFANALPAAAAAVRQNAAPGCLIGAAAIWWRQYPNVADFVAGIYAQLGNAASLMDYLNLHFYSNAADPSTDGTGTTYTPSLSQALTKMQAAAAGAGDGAKKIWLTEIGWNVFQVNTTASASVAAGTQTVTPASMTHITAGKKLTIDPTGTVETITVSSVTSTTFTATFASSHSAGYQIQSQDDCDAPTQASRFAATMATTRTNGFAGKYFFYTLDYATSTFSSSSLVQYGYTTPGVYGNLPAYSTVQSFISANPQWGIIPSPSSLSESGPATQNVTLRNGGAAGTWSAVVTTTSGGAWLSTSATSGTLATDATQSVTISVNSLASSLSPGTYSGTVTYTVNGFVSTVAVTLTVTNPVTIILATRFPAMSRRTGLFPVTARRTGQFPAMIRRGAF